MATAEILPGGTQPPESRRRPAFLGGRRAQGKEESPFLSHATELFAQAIEARLRYLDPITKLQLLGLAVEFGHTDAPSLHINNTAGIDLREEQDLDRVVDVQTGPKEVQRVQWTVPAAMRSLKTFMTAAFTAKPNRLIEDFSPPQDFFESLGERDRVINEFIDSQKNLRQIRTVEDLRKVLRLRHRRGLFKSVEGLYVDENNYETALEKLQKDGYTSIGIIWNHDTKVGHTANAGERRAQGPDEGLTAMGVNVVKEIDKRGMVTDLSHASRKTQYDVLAIESELPRVFTHAGSRAVTDHPRNVDDYVARLVINGGRFIREGDKIRIIEDGDQAPYGIEVHKVKKGGIIGMPMVATFVKKDLADENEKPTVENVVDHLEHFKEIGLLHGIALGTDFAGMGESDVVKGVENVTVFRKNLREAMLRRGFSKKEIRMVFRENALKFWLRNLPRERELPGQERTVFTLPPDAA